MFMCVPVVRYSIIMRTTFLGGTAAVVLCFAELGFANSSPAYLSKPSFNTSIGAQTSAGPR